MWNALIDYRLFSRLTLENDIKGKMLCRCCLAKYFDSGKHRMDAINVDHFGLKVNSDASAFAMILVVECNSGIHSYVIEPPRRDHKEQLEKDGECEPPKKKWGQPMSTHHIRDYAINYQAFLLTQVMGNSVTSLGTTMGLLGLGLHSGSHHECMYIGHELGKAGQKWAKQGARKELTN